MIMPARWYAGGKGLDDFRNNMLADKRLKKLVDFPESRECFPSADIAGGICYILWDKQYSGNCNVTTVNNGYRTTYLRDLSEFDTFVRQASAIDILHKVSALKEITFNNHVYSRKPFGLGNNYIGKLECFDNSITLFGSQGLSYITMNEITQNQDVVSKWKVIVSKASAQGGRADKDGKRKVLPKAEVLSPMSVCTESYLLVDCFDTQQEAKNALSYIKTMFFRFLLSLKVITQNIAKESFAFVPLQDFTRPWTDADLYAKYNLTEDEIQFIESMVKPME